MRATITHDLRFLDSLVSQRSECKEPEQALVQKRKAVESIQIIRSLLLANKLKHRKLLSQVIARCIQLFPAWLSDSMQHEFEHGSVQVSTSTLQRAQVILDASLLHVAAYRNNQKSFLFYFLADSSPQGQFDWLISEYYKIAVEDAALIFREAQQLCNDVEKSRFFLQEMNHHLQEFVHIRNYKQLGICCKIAVV